MVKATKPRPLFSSFLSLAGLVQAEHRKEKKAGSVLESIETWCNAQKEILALKETIRVAETEHDILLHAIWSAGPRWYVHAKEANRAKIGSMKKRVKDLQSMNDISIGAWLVHNNKGINNWQDTRKIARMAKCKAIWLSATQCPKSWHCCAPVEEYKK